MLILLRVAVLGVLLGILPAAAQWPSAPPDSARRDFRQRLLQALDLTPAQRDSLRWQRDALQAALDSLRQQVDGGQVLPEEGRLRYRELLEGYRNDRDSLLTSRQRQLLERARQHQQHIALSDGQPPPEAPLRLVDALELTQDQRRRWLALLARQRDQVQQLEEAGQIITSEDILRLREEHRLVFEAILTPDQRLELERYRQSRARRQIEAAAQLDADLELLEDTPTESYRDGWESVESDLGEDGAEP